MQRDSSQVDWQVSFAVAIESAIRGRGIIRSGGAAGEAPLQPLEGAPLEACEENAARRRRTVLLTGFSKPSSPS